MLENNMKLVIKYAISVGSSQLFIQANGHDFAKGFNCSQLKYLQSGNIYYL